MSGSGGKRFVVVAALVVIALSMAGALDNGFVNWDDGIYIANNPLVTDPGAQPWRARVLTPALGYAIPIPVLLYGWLWAIGGAGEAWPFHAFTVAVHVLNVGLLIAMLRRSGVRPRIAAVAGVAFGLHPIVVEPAVWATGLKDLLVATGTLLAMIGFRRGPWAIPGALLAFGSKPTSILLALPLWAMARVWGGDGPFDRDRRMTDRTRTTPTLVAVAVVGAALGWFTVSQETAALRTSSVEPFSVTRIFGALGLQIEHVVAPGTLAPRYAPTLVGPAEIALGALAVAGLGWLAWRWVRNRDPRLPWLMLGIAAYAPVSNLRPLERFTADSYLYLPWMATVACVAMTWPAIETALHARSPRVVPMVRAFVAVAALAWGGLTVMQVEVWTDSRTLWRDCYLEQPTDPETIYRYGDALGRAGQLREELKIYLDHESDLERGARIPVVLPVYYERTGDLDRAAWWYGRAFDSPVEQDEGMYWHYVEFVGRLPDRHDRRLDDALAYAIQLYAAQRGLGRLDAQQRSNIVAEAERLGLQPAGPGS